MDSDAIPSFGSAKLPSQGGKFHPAMLFCVSRQSPATSAPRPAHRSIFRGIREGHPGSPSIKPSLLAMELPCRLTKRALNIVCIRTRLGL